MAPRPVENSTRFEDSFPDEFMLTSQPLARSFCADTSRFGVADPQVVRPVEILEKLDPCKMTDEERELLQRFKRREDAFKTALCDTFRRTGTCTYGDKCRFAHTQGELRVPQQPRGRLHPKYKTVLCENFERDGECRYGSRCMYIHRRNGSEPEQISYQFRPDVVSSSTSFTVPGLHSMSMDHKPPPYPKDRRRQTSSRTAGYNHLHNFSFQPQMDRSATAFNGDVSLPHFIQGPSPTRFNMNSSTSPNITNISRTAPSPTNPAELVNGMTHMGICEMVNRVSIKSGSGYARHANDA